MKLNRLTEICPVCKSRLVSARWGYQHTNGQFPENTEYECGCKMHYIPNYEGRSSAIGYDMPCNRDPNVLYYTGKLDVEMSIVSWPVPNKEFIFENIDLRAEANEALVDSSVRKLIVLQHRPVVIAVKEVVSRPLYTGTT